MKKKMTALEWYSDKLMKILGDKCNEFTAEQTMANHYALKEAKQLEKQQIVDGVYAGYNYDGARLEERAEQYYIETYNLTEPI